MCRTGILRFSGSWRRTSSWTSVTQGTTASDCGSRETLNQALPNQLGQNLPLKARRPNAEFDYIDSNFDAGFSTYNDLQVKLEKRYARGLYLLNSFTWSKAIDNGSGALEMGNGDQQSINIFDSKFLKGTFGGMTSRSTTPPPCGLGPAVRTPPSIRLQHATRARCASGRMGGLGHRHTGQRADDQFDRARPHAAFIATDGSKNSAIYRPNITGNVMEPAGQRSIYEYFNPNNVQT